MSLGENIYKLRTEKNMSQGELADALEVSRQSVSKWENNSAVPELEKLRRMARIFGVTIDELVTGNPPDPAAPPQPEPKVIYIQQPAKSSITPVQILGIILTVCAILALVISVLFMSERDWEESLFPLCIPIAVCGIICIIAKRHAGYFCALCLYLLTALPSFILMTNPVYGAMAQIVYIALLACGVCLLIYTIVRYRKLQFSGVFKVVILAALLLALILQVAAMLPPQEQEAIPREGYISTIESSVSPD